MDERTHDYAGSEDLAGGRELPIRGEVVRIVAGDLAGEEAMVEGVERDLPADRTFVWLRIHGFPWTIREPAYAVIRLGGTQASNRGHRWGPRKPL